MTKDRDDTVTWEEVAEGSGYTADELKALVLERLAKLDSGEAELIDAEDVFREEYADDPEGLERFYRIRDAHFRGEQDPEVTVRQITEGEEPD